jgi:hypothetical protein
MQLSKTEIKSKRLITLNSAIADHRAKLHQLYDKALKSLAQLIHIDYLFPSRRKVHTNFIFKNILRTERQADLAREAKFKRLLPKLTYPETSIKIHNFSNISIPEQIHSILSRGLNSGIGGHPDNHKILSESEKLIKNLDKHAENSNVNRLKFFELKNDLQHQLYLLRGCYNNDNKGQILNKWLNENPNLVICKVDKSKNIVIYDDITYNNKLEKEFSNLKQFRRLGRNPLKTNQRDLNEILKDYKRYVSKKTFKSLTPIPSL